MVPLIAVLTACWSACTSFSSDSPASPAPPTDEAGTGAEAAVVDGARPDGAVAPLETVTVAAPTELVLDDTTVYIATSAGIETWTPGMPATTPLVSATGAHVLRVGYGSIFYADKVDALFVLPLTGADAGVSVMCKPSAHAVALLRNSVVYADVTTVGLTSTACVARSTVSSSRAELLANDSSTLFRYEAATSGGRIASCTALPTCDNAGVSTELATNVGAVTQMIVDADRIYWATSDAVFSLLKTGGGQPTMLASGQHLPKALSASGGFLFWTTYDDGTVMRAPSDGSAMPSIVAQGLNHPWGLVATPTDVLVSESGANRVLRFARP
jgi:hypothetical protein